MINVSKAAIDSGHFVKTLHCTSIVYKVAIRNGYLVKSLQLPTTVSKPAFFVNGFFDFHAIAKTDKGIERDEKEKEKAE